MQAKKAVFFLLLGLVICALATLLVHKFDLLARQTKSWSPEEEFAIKLLKGHKHCLLTAGLKLDLVPTKLTNQYKLESLKGLPVELKGKLFEGDLIMGPQLMNLGSLIGETQSLSVVDAKTGLTRVINYTIKPIIDCQ
jgi:hypothetical protein